MKFVNWGAASHVYSGEKWKTRTKSRFSQRFSHLQWRRLNKESWNQQRTADFGSPFWQVPYTSNFACWKIRFRGMYLFTISYGCNGSKKWSWLISVDELRSSSSTRGISRPNFEVLDATIALALNKIIHNSHFKRKISLEEQKAQKQDRFLRDKQIAYLIYDHFRVTGAPWFCRKLCRPIHCCSSKWRKSGIRF